MCLRGVIRAQVKIGLSSLIRSFLVNLATAIFHMTELTIFWERDILETGDEIEIDFPSFHLKFRDFQIERINFKFQQLLLRLRFGLFLSGGVPLNERTSQQTQLTARRFNSRHIPTQDDKQRRFGSCSKIHTKWQMNLSFSNEYLVKQFINWVEIRVVLNGVKTFLRCFTFNLRHRGSFIIQMSQFTN
jgi:hypothetical protein